MRDDSSLTSSKEIVEMMYERVAFKNENAAVVICEVEAISEITFDGDNSKLFASQKRSVRR